MVQRASYALVLMDYLMPVTNGIEATRCIREWERKTGRPATPIAAVTASAMPSECRRYFDAGMNDLLLKPFTATALAALLLRYQSAQPSALVIPQFTRHGATS